MLLLTLRHQLTRPGAAPGEGESKLGYRRVHGALATFGIKVAASTVWSILKEHGIPPTPERQHTTWAAFLRTWGP